MWTPLLVLVGPPQPLIMASLKQPGRHPELGPGCGPALGLTEDQEEIEEAAGQVLVVVAEVLVTVEWFLHLPQSFVCQQDLSLSMKVAGPSWQPT